MPQHVQCRLFLIRKIEQLTDDVSGKTRFLRRRIDYGPIIGANDKYLDTLLGPVHSCSIATTGSQKSHDIRVEAEAKPDIPKIL